MKKFVYLFSVSFLLLSCKDDTNPINTDPPNLYAQKEIDWPSLRKAPWPMYRHDPQLTGRTRHPGPVAGILADSISVGNDISSIVIDNDSVYFVSSSGGLVSKNLTKWKYNTTLVWGKHFDVWNDAYNSPTLLQDQSLYYVTPRKVWHITNDTTVQWNYTLTQDVFCFATMIDKVGNLYLKHNPGGITVLTPNGDVLWTLSTPPTTLHAAAFSPDGNTLYVTASQLLAIDIPSRSLKWKGDSIGIMTSPVVDNGGNIYCFIKNANKQNETFASFSASGQRRWIYEGLTSIKPSTEHGIAPVIDWDGNVYCATDTLYSFTNTGKLRWKFGFGPGERNYTSLTCDGSNTIYVLTTDDNIYAISSAGSLKWKLYIPNAWFGNTPSIADGKLFVPTAYQQKVYIIQ